MENTRIWEVEQEMPAAAIRTQDFILVTIYHSAENNTVESSLMERFSKDWSHWQDVMWKQLNVHASVFGHHSVPLQSEEKRFTGAAADASGDTTADVSEPSRADDAAADRGHPKAPQLHPEGIAEPTSPPKTPSSVSLAESVQSTSHSESVCQRSTYCVWSQEVEYYRKVHLCR